MRNRIKQLLNKEEGFTLVELLGVIVILAIILAIAVPGIGKIIDNAKEDTEKNQTALVLDAAQLYFLQEEGTSVTVEELIKKGFLEDKKDSTLNKDLKITEEEAKKGSLNSGITEEEAKEGSPD